MIILLIFLIQCWVYNKYVQQQEKLDTPKITCTLRLHLNLENTLLVNTFPECCIRFIII